MVIYVAQSPITAMPSFSLICTRPQNYDPLILIKYRKFDEMAKHINNKIDNAELSSIIEAQLGPDQMIWFQKIAIDSFLSDYLR